MWALIKRWIPALRSRKTRVAITGVIVTTAAKIGFDLPNEIVYSVLVLATALITGIAIEDHGEKSARRTATTTIRTNGSN